MFCLSLQKKKKKNRYGQKWSTHPLLTGCFGLVSSKHQNLLSLEWDSDFIQIGTSSTWVYVMSSFCEDNRIFPRTDQNGHQIWMPVVFYQLQIWSRHPLRLSLQNHINYWQDKTWSLESPFITAADNQHEQEWKCRIHQPAANWHVTHTVDTPIDQSGMGDDLVNKHVSDGGILGDAPVVSLKWLRRISRQTRRESVGVWFGWDSLRLHSALLPPLRGLTCCFHKWFSVIDFLAKCVWTKMFTLKRKHPMWCNAAKYLIH